MLSLGQQNTTSSVHDQRDNVQAYADSIDPSLKTNPPIDGSSEVPSSIDSAEKGPTGVDSRILDQATEPETPYHVYTKRRKWALVYIVSFAAMFSPLSSNIYFPAINTISVDLGVNASLVALTVTIYMLVQGIAPSFFGPISDTCGRRLVFTVTLSIYLAANLALAFTANYPMLVVLRGVQAAGSSATISISTGVIADIAMPSERGGFIGTNSGIRMIGQAIGPVFGGILNGVAGFRSIFWLLFAMSAFVLVALLALLPETHRAIADSGAIPLSGFHKPWIYIVRPPKDWTQAQHQTKTKTPPLSFKTVFTPLTWVFEKDIFSLLTWGALVYTVWSMVTSSTTTVLVGEYPALTQVQLGLCFLPNGCGCVLGSIVTGKIMDRMYKRVERQYRQEKGISDSVKLKNDQDFPYERARLAPMPYLSGIFIFAIALYGAT